MSFLDWTLWRGQKVFELFQSTKKASKMEITQKIKISFSRVKLSNCNQCPSFLNNKMVLRPGFGPGSATREAAILSPLIRSLSKV